MPRAAELGRYRPSSLILCCISRSDLLNIRLAVEYRMVSETQNMEPGNQIGKTGWGPTIRRSTSHAQPSPTSSDRAAGVTMAHSRQSLDSLSLQAAASQGGMARGRQGRQSSTGRAGRPGRVSGEQGQSMHHIGAVQIVLCKVADLPSS